MQKKIELKDSLKKKKKEHELLRVRGVSEIWFTAPRSPHSCSLKASYSWSHFPPPYTPF